MSGGSTFNRLAAETRVGVCLKLAHRQRKCVRARPRRRSGVPARCGCDRPSLQREREPLSLYCATREARRTIGRSRRAVGSVQQRPPDRAVTCVYGDGSSRVLLRGRALVVAAAAPPSNIGFAGKADKGQQIIRTGKACTESHRQQEQIRRGATHCGAAIYGRG